MSDRQELEIRRRINAAIESGNQRAELDARRELRDLVGSMPAPESIAAPQQQATQPNPRAQDLSMLESRMEEFEDVTPFEAFKFGVGAGMERMGANTQMIAGFLLGDEQMGLEALGRGQEVRRSREELGEIFGGGVVAGDVAAEAATIPATMAVGQGVGTIANVGRLGRFAQPLNIVAQSGLAATEAGIMAQDMEDIGSAAGTAAGFTAALEGISPIAGRMFRRARAGRSASRDMLEGTQVPEVAEAGARSARRVEEAQDLLQIPEEARATISQATADPARLGAQSYLSRLPEHSQDALRRLQAQDTAAYDSLLRIMDDVAPREGVEVVDSTMLDYAGDMISEAANNRRRVASPMYDAVFDGADDAGFRVDVNDILEMISAKQAARGSKHASSSVLGEYGDALREFADENGTISLRHIESAQQIGTGELDRLQGQIATGTQSAPVNTAGYDLQQVVDLVEDRATQYAPYANANAEYYRLSQPVNRLRRGLFGQIAKTDPNSPQLPARVQRLFSNPRTIRANADLFNQSEEGREAWGAMTRRFMEDRLQTAGVNLEELFDVPIEELPNRAQQIRQALFKGDVGARIRAALPEDQRRNFNALGDYLESIQRGRPVGSDTAPNLRIEEYLTNPETGSVASIVDFATGPITGVKGLSRLGEGGERLLRARALFEAVTNPDLSAAYTAARRTRNRAKQSEMMRNLLDNSARLIFAREFGVDQIPEALEVTRRLAGRRPEDIGEAVGNFAEDDVE